MIKVKGTAKLFQPEEDIEIPILAQFVDYLSPKVCAVTADDDGSLTGFQLIRKKVILPSLHIFPSI